MKKNKNVNCLNQVLYYKITILERASIINYEQTLLTEIKD